MSDRQIESREGVANIDEIVTVPGVGVIFIGPSDLTASLGFPPAEEVEAAIQPVLSQASTLRLQSRGARWRRSAEPPATLYNDEF